MYPIDVSRETEVKLSMLAELVRKWNKSVNLVASSTIDELESRHIGDCLQIATIAPPHALKWVDLGSGGGFPGLVVAAYLSVSNKLAQVTLIEADKRKAVFLKEASRLMNLRTIVIDRRIEAIPPLAADVVTARALAPLSVLLSYAQLHCGSDGCAIFLKGKTVHQELADANVMGWHYVFEEHKSRTNDTSSIIKVRNPIFAKQS